MMKYIIGAANNELTKFLVRVIGAQHCSSLCSQSEGHGYVAKNVCGCAASALKGQPVQSPGQRPGYQRINAYAL